MDINWIDEIPGSVQGTPVNRLRLMGMQGYFPGTINIVKTSDKVTTITATSTEGTTTTTITKSATNTKVVRKFVAGGKTITQTTTISKSGDTTNVSQTTTG